MQHSASGVSRQQLTGSVAAAEPFKKRQRLVVCAVHPAASERFPLVTKTRKGELARANRMDEDPYAKRPPLDVSQRPYCPLSELKNDLLIGLLPKIGGEDYKQ